MIRIKLRKLLLRDAKTKAIIQQLMDFANSPIAIVDEQEQCLLGSIPTELSTSHKLEVRGQVIGKVYGGDAAFAVINFINLLIKQTLEKKKLGNEILDLYREVNLMYNFAQKLAESIEPAQIAQLTLEETKSLVNNDEGLVAFWNEHKSHLQIVAQNGIPPASENDLNNPSSIYAQLTKKTEADILNQQVLEDDSKTSLLYVPLKVKNNTLGFILLFNTSGYQFTAADLKLLSTISLQAASAIESARLFEKNIKEVKEREAAIRTLHDITSRFVPNEFIQSLGYKHITQVTLGDSVEKEVTVLFSDIRGYTSLSEKMSPKDTFKFVNAFNNRMGPIILRNRGFINQYLGDGIMAIFPFSPSDALQAAVEMQQELHVYNIERIAKDRAPIKIGIGLHTGPLIMGITGDDKRLDATSISDTVNTAARIESLTKTYGVNIMLTEYSWQKIKNKEKQNGHSFLLRYLGDVQVKGKKQAIKIYECFDGDPPEMIHSKKHFLKMYEAALEDFYDKKFLEAAAVFNQIVFKNPLDRTAFFFLNKTNQLISEGVQANWTGIERMAYK